MEEILKEWLRRSLNIQTKWNTEVEDEIKNGYIVAKILHYYNIINDEKTSIIMKSNKIKHIESNWNFLHEWLRDIGIIMSDDEVETVKEGSKQNILRLFYQLFLFLDKRDRSDFIKQERKMVSTLVEKPANRFIITGAYIEENAVEDDLAKPILNEKLFIDWQRKKADEIKEMYELARRKYLKMAEKPLEPMVNVMNSHKLSDINKKDIETFNLKHSTLFENYTYEELIALDSKTKDNPNTIDLEWTKEYMNNLFTRLNKKSDSEEFQKQMIQSITTTMWSSSVEENECTHDVELANEVMKLSMFEKQMSTQIMETKQQVRNLVKNRIIAENEFAKGRENQFNIFIDLVKEDINSGLLEINFEHQRNQNLHARLYAEKNKRKRKLYYEICFETVLSLIDYATKYGYYKRLMGDIPDKFIEEWKLLYFKKQPIFDILIPIDDIVIKNDENDAEEIYDLSLENIRQECLNESEFTEYLDYSDPWALDVLLANYDPESEDRKYEHMGKNILTHVVYTLLELKYPPPPKRQSANLPMYSVKSLVIDVPNMSIDLAMQRLLNKRKILVLRVESCVDFCLKQFKAEMKDSIDISLPLKNKSENIKEDSAKGLIKNSISNRKLNSAKSVLSITTHKNLNTKQTQTPDAIPEEDIALSNTACLGKQAFEMLSSGDSLSTDLIAAMLAEYIKEQKDITGFVILNYPNTYIEARILEEVFSGKRPPDLEYDCNDESLLEVEIHCYDEEDPLKELRKSNILKFEKVIADSDFDSYFTSYIKLKKSVKIDSEFCIWDLTQDNSEAIDRFYSAVGANYSIYYENIDKEQLALICRYVIGDFEFPLKSDDELFGRNVLDELEFPVSENRKSKSKIIKTESTNSKIIKQNSNIHTKSKTLINTTGSQLDKIQENVSELNLKEIEVKSPTPSKTHNITWVDAEEVIAGDKNWEYGKIQIQRTLGLSLASCWEEIEKCYVNDVQQLLFSKRLQLNCLVPYTTFIYHKMKNIVTLPSPKQDLVWKFQEEYNSLDDDWRENDITKNEWHCRVKELQNKLYDICDERKKFSEQQKQSIIYENWICDELIIFANTYVSLMQTELNRFVLTYQILHDYYITIGNKPISQRLSLKELSKFIRDSDEKDITTKTKASEEKYKQVKDAFLELQLKNINIDSDNNPLNVFIDDNVKLALRYIREISESYKTIVAQETNNLILKFQNASSPSLKKKFPKDSKIMGESVEVQKLELIKCMKEWKMACIGETFRVNLRIAVLQKKCYEDMKIFCNQLFKTYKNIQVFIDDQYINEVKSVDRLSNYIQMAIEINEKIPEILLLNGDSFVIDPNVLHMPRLSTKGENANEATGEIEFKLSQIALLRDSFKTVAPTGIVIQQTFIYLLQDFVLFGKELCNGQIFPLMWRRIDPERIPEFVFSVFGENVYVDWRDFLIYCLNIGFPTIDELLQVCKLFRCQSKSKELIDREIFLNTCLWFENEFGDSCQTRQLRNTLLKHFLFELFEVSKDSMNYTGLLLAFCKSKDPKEGFSKALALTLGKKICYSTQECKEDVDQLIEIKKIKDEEHECLYKDISIFMDLIIHNVLDICVGTTIIELKDVIKDGRKSKGRLTNRSKTSTRSSHTEIISKQVLPARNFDIKMTSVYYQIHNKSDTVFINKKLKEQKDEENVHNSDIIYSVSRSIIWKVLEICVPWHFELAEHVECTYKFEIDKIIDQLEYDTEDKSIYVSKFLAQSKVCEFLHKIKRFSKPDMYEEILKIIED